MRTTLAAFTLALATLSVPLEAQSPPQAMVECESPGKAIVRITVHRVTYVVRVDCGTSV